MAPSRALLRLLRASPSSSTRFVSTSCRIPHRSTPSIPIPRSSAVPIAYRICVPSLSSRRAYSTPDATGPAPPDYLNEKELHIFEKVKGALEPVKLEVQDISGGCGSMYAIEIESAKFAGLSVIKQHKMVNEVLKEEIKGWHGVQLRTKAC